MFNLSSGNILIDNDPALCQLSHVFGDVVLIPVDSHTLQPTAFQWKDMTLEQSRATSNLNQLWETSVGVRCGAESANLIALGFDSSESLDRFLQNNPLFRETALIQYKETYWLFYRCSDELPRSQRLQEDGCHLQSDGWLLVHCRDRLGEPVEFLQSLPVRTFEAAEIRWNEETEVRFLLQRLVSKYGSLVKTERRGKKTLNAALLAEYFGALLHIRFDPVAEVFFIYDPTSDNWIPQGEKEIEVKTFKLLSNLSRVEGFTCLAPFQNARTARAITLEMKVVVSNDVPSDVNGLELFATTALARTAGSDVTTQELFLAYKAFCVKNKMPELSERRFKCEISQLIYAHFKITKSNCIKRDGSARKGFFNIGIVRKDG
jgi:hypothetical protein